ncbi:hypothetical protein CYLTODRAFT_368051 [Cylindrobasidium torrendii FP15055 ss-10]|uniref:Uncharacterized protein n=1 Tax=Cylindrobasidium torrendii FP15055 ss-10 TaxID=1314674 RepID=A0A0D7BP61_9AGAR|nr:hypothetical protein CYLTODRAFT_368051 [Cylindrobasidium torrendii FP15055 ss-10]
MSEHSQYAAMTNVPLIKSPSLRAPPPVELPQDIHPLPESVDAYSVYPYTLEPHILTVESARRTTMASHAARYEKVLRTRTDEKEQRKREALRRIAPGFEPTGSLLVPVRTGTASTEPPVPVVADSPFLQKQKSAMDDLVDQLAALDSKGSTT